MKHTAILGLRISLLLLPCVCIAQSMQEGPVMPNQQSEGACGTTPGCFVEDETGFNPWEDTLVGSWDQDAQDLFDTGLYSVPFSVRIDELSHWDCNKMQNAVQYWRFERHRNVSMGGVVARADGGLICEDTWSKVKVWAKETNIGYGLSGGSFGLPERGHSHAEYWECRFERPDGESVGESEGSVYGEGNAMASLESSAPSLSSVGAAVEVQARVRYLSKHNGVPHGDFEINAEQGRSTDPTTLTTITVGSIFTVPITPTYGWSSYAMAPDFEAHVEDDGGLDSWTLTINTSGLLAAQFFIPFGEQHTISKVKGAAYAFLTGSIFLTDPE